MRGAGHISRHQGSWRCSEWKYTGIRRPVVAVNGYFSFISGSEIGLSGGSLYVGRKSSSSSGMNVSMSVFQISILRVGVPKPGLANSSSAFLSPYAFSGIMPVS